MLFLCFALMSFLFSIAPPSCNYVTMAVLKQRYVESEDYEALAFSRRSINLELDEENMQPERSTMAPRNAVINPSTTQMKRCHRGQDRVSDKNSLTRMDGPSNQARELIADDEERVAMRQGDMPPPVPERVANPRIQEDRAVQDFQKNSGKMHRATSDDAYTIAWFYFCRSVFPQSVRKAGPDVDLYIVSSYQCSILFNNMRSFSRKTEFWKTENMHQPFLRKRNSTLPTTGSCHFSENFGRNDYAHVTLTAEADSFPTDENEFLDDYGMVGCYSSRSEDLPVHARIHSSRYVPSLWESDDDRKGHVLHSLTSSLARRQKEQPHNNLKN